MHDTYRMFLYSNSITFFSQPVGSLVQSLNPGGCGTLRSPELRPNSYLYCSLVTWRQLCMRKVRRFFVIVWLAMLTPNSIGITVQHAASGLNHILPKTILGKTVSYHYPFTEMMSTLTEILKWVLFQWWHGQVTSPLKTHLYCGTGQLRCSVNILLQSIPTGISWKKSRTMLGRWSTQCVCIHGHPLATALWWAPFKATLNGFINTTGFTIIARICRALFVGHARPMTILQCRFLIFVNQLLTLEVHRIWKNSMIMKPLNSSYPGLMYTEYCTTVCILNC